jgi:hypothetical protein
MMAVKIDRSLSYVYASVRCACSLPFFIFLTVHFIFVLFFFFSSHYQFESCICRLLGDVPQPIIKARGNRTYFCKWFREATAAHTEMKALGMTNSTDLFEVVY